MSSNLVKSIIAIFSKIKSAGARDPGEGNFKNSTFTKEPLNVFFFFFMKSNNKQDFMTHNKNKLSV